jgi:hypothetical protein
MLNNSPGAVLCERRNILIKQRLFGENCEVVAGDEKLFGSFAAAKLGGALIIHSSGDELGVL